MFTEQQRLRVGMVGLGMIFEETYWPLLEQLDAEGLFARHCGLIRVELSAVASRTGTRAEPLRKSIPTIVSFAGPDAVQSLAQQPVDVVCIATPDDRHFAAARTALAAGKHVIIEKPSVLRLQELDELTELARANGVLAKVVYHKLFDPDHKKLRTHLADGVLRHVNNGYCSLLEPKRIARQFTEWIGARNPGAYVAVHYLKLIDFTFGPGWRLRCIRATGQRGLVAASDSPTWDSVQLQVAYEYPDGREAAFDIHTSWVAPDEFPGSVEQEVQFRFDNGIWNAHQRKRGVEMTVEMSSNPPSPLPQSRERRERMWPITPNHHYSAEFLEPWGERRWRGYGLEAVRRFFEEVAYVEFGGEATRRAARLEQMRSLTYNDLAADRNVVAGVQGMEATLARHAAGVPDCFVTVNSPRPGLWLHEPNCAEPKALYERQI